MPMAAPKVCAHAGCMAIASSGSRCDKHISEATSWGAWQNGRTSSQRGYGAMWRKIRADVMVRDNYLCQTCKRAKTITAANAVDHIKPKSQGGTDNMNNLEAICNDCHKTKTAQGN